MDKVVIAIIASIAGGAGGAALVGETLNAMKALSSNDKRIVLFDKSRSSLKRGNAQVLAGEYSGGLATIRIGAFYFSTSQNVTNVLWFRFRKSQTSLYHAGVKMTLNTDIYDSVREAIKSKLTRYLPNYVYELPIGDP